MRKRELLLALVPLSTLLLSSPSQARLNIFTAGVTTGFDYSETNYDREEIEDEIPTQDSYLKNLFIGPLFIFKSSSSIDEININYSPRYTYDFETSSSDYKYTDFSLSAYRDFSKKLRLNLSDNFAYSNDPDNIETENSSNYNRGRRVYYTNTFSASSSYAYDTGSSLGGGYTYDIIRNEDTGPGGYEDYDKHIADINIQHRFNAIWNAGATASYTRGLFDPPDPLLVDTVATGLEEISNGITSNINTDDLSNDLTEYRFSASLGWTIAPTKTVNASYDFSATDYDALLRFDTNLHNLTLGAQYKHSSRLNFGFGGGPSYEKTDTFDPNWGYNAHLDLDYNLSKHSSFSASVTKGYDQENFSANNNDLGRDEGLTAYWNYSLNYTQQLLKPLSLNLFISYRDERQENLVHGLIAQAENDTAILETDRETFREDSVFDRDIYTAGGGLTYSFMQYWTSSLKYSYRKQDSESINDSYDEHRIYLTLSVQKELFRW